MLEYSASTTIAASPETVWSILMDTASYPEWDPYCERIEGTPALGAQIKAFTTLAPGRAFPVKVTELTPSTIMRWRGGMPLGLFVGERVFELAPSDEGVRFTVTERFTGPLLGLFRRSLPDMNEPFARFAAGLKARAES